jgi:predicted ester cyclase
LQASFEVVKRHYTSFPDWRHAIEDLVAEGDRVAVKIMQKGTQKAEYGGVAPTGKEVTMPGAYMFRVANGKVQELWVIEDNLGLYLQLGLELKPKGTK